MVRFTYVIVMNLLLCIYFIIKMRYYAAHGEIYTERDCYRLALRVITIIKRSGHIRTGVTGLENLPPQGGYLMIPNHQGKYDALGIMITHHLPCRFIIHEETAKKTLVREFTDLLKSKRIVPEDPRQSIRLFNDVAEEIRAGKKYILFPEGGYKKGQKNAMSTMKPGSFKLALKARAPIVPIALIDSYKPFNSSDIGKVTTFVRYLDPIPYESFRKMRTPEIAALVQTRIETAIRESLISDEWKDNCYYV